MTLLPSQTTVLEILETVEPDAELVEACAELGRMGYRLALDDFVPRPEMQPLVQMASYVKVDFQLSDASMRGEIRRMTQGAMPLCWRRRWRARTSSTGRGGEGFEYFQGYFFCRPKIVASREIPPNRHELSAADGGVMREPLDLPEVSHDC